MDYAKEYDRMVEQSNKQQETIESLRQRLAISEAEGLEQARLLGMSGEREAALRAEIDRLHNQLAAANAELVRKQDRDSQYSNVCCKLSSKENEVAQLRQQLAEKNAEIERLNSSPTIEACRQMIRDKPVIEASVLHEQLTTSQAREQQLQDALRELLCYNEKSTWIGGVENGYSVPVGSAKLKVISHCEEILSIPSDTTALEAMITKAGEVMRESVIEQCIAMGAMSRDGAFVEEIRALPDVTLEDIRAS